MSSSDSDISNAGTKQKQISVGQIAEAEKILNRTLAYQAAIAVHELKDRLDLDVAELRLSVTPADDQVVGAYLVACHVIEARSSQPLTLEVIVHPDEAVLATHQPIRKQG